MSARPIFLNLVRLKYPPGALASFGHRVSGVVLVLALPFAVFALARSLESEAAFRSIAAPLESWPDRIALLVLAWAAAQHLFAGIRHLLMEGGIGSSLSAARRSAYAALIAAAAVALAVVLA